MPKTKKYLLTGVLLAALTIILDQVTKYAILDLFKESSHHLTITSFFDLVLTWNKGISFGFMSSYGNAGTIVLIVVSILISLGLFVWLTRVTNMYLACGLGLIIGGAIGNLIDRFHYKAVVDFLYFHLDTYSFPAFNVADTAITIGVGFMLLESFIMNKGEHRA